MFQTDLLKGKHILITGGGTGLGLSMGRRCLELGADLVICGRREAVLQEAAAKLRPRPRARSRPMAATSASPAVEAMFGRSGTSGRSMRW